MQCKFCGDEFEPKTAWQEACSKKKCQLERRRENASKWYRKNRFRKLKYQKEYRLL